MASEYQQTNCKASIDGQYVSVEFKKGSEEKNVNFVTDGITYWSDSINANAAEGYGGIGKIIFRSASDTRRGILQFRYLDGTRGIEQIGRIDLECWREIGALLKSNPRASHIELQMISAVK